MAQQSELARAAQILESAAALFDQTPVFDAGDTRVLAMQLYVHRWLPNHLVQPVLDFLMEAIGPFQEMLDALAGDPAAISAHASQVRDAASRVSGDHTDRFIAAAHVAAASWEGEAADAFRHTADTFPRVLSGYGTAAHRVADLAELTGANVGAVRALVRDTISDCLVEVVRVATRMALTAGAVTAAGAAAGAVAGAAAGSVLGPVGTLIGGLAGGLAGGFAGLGAGATAAIAEFIAWAGPFINDYVQYCSQVLQELVGVTTEAMGQMYGLGTTMTRAASLLQGTGDPGEYGRVRPGSFGDDMAGADPDQRDMTLAALIADFPDGDGTVTDPVTEQVYTRLTDDELRALGLDPALLADDGDGFLAGVYRAIGPDGQTQLVVVMGATTIGADRNPDGTTAGILDDVVEDAIGGLVPSPQAMDAIRLAEAVQATGTGDDVVYTGHSLGGRLAAVASMTTGNAAVTFNAAGVSDPMLAYCAGMTGADPDEMRARLDAGQIRGYQTSDDPLTFAQENAGGVSGAMPDIPGTQHRIDGQQGSLATGHGIVNVMDSLASEYGWQTAS